MINFSRKSSDRNILFFTVHKAASMFIYKVCHELSKEAGLNYYSVNHMKRNRFYFDTEESDLEDSRLWEDKSGCFAPLRYYFELPDSLEAWIIVHLRDPRDVLVSLYYSEAYSHGVIKGVFELDQAERERIKSMGIDEFALSKADDFNKRYLQYRALLSRPNSVFVKYEDLVLNFPLWLSEVARVFGIENDKTISRICRKYRNEFEIKKENIHAHKRKIIPGDYREKLRPETIAELNRIFRANLEAYDYAF